MRRNRRSADFPCRVIGNCVLMPIWLGSSGFVIASAPVGALAFSAGDSERDLLECVDQSWSMPDIPENRIVVDIRWMLPPAGYGCARSGNIRQSTTNGREPVGTQ